MATYKIRKIIWEEIDLDDEEVMTVAEAAKELDSPYSTVMTNAETGRLTVVIKEDPEKPWATKRMLLKKEIEEWKKEH